MVPDTDMHPTTPVVKPDTPRAPDDPNEVLFGDDELAEDETDDLE